MAPTKPRSIRFSRRDEEHLRRLQELLDGRSQTDVISIALTNLLVTLERGEPVHMTRTEPSSS